MKKSLVKIKKIYEDDLKKFGDNHRGVGWNNKSQAEIRYKIMSELFKNDNKKKTVLDFGCGMSHFFSYLKKRKFKKIRYVGLDISEKMIQISKKKYPKNQYFCLDILTHPKKIPTADYVIINGLFTQSANYNKLQMNRFLTQILLKVFKYTKKAIAFNLMSQNVDWKKKGNFYPDLDFVFNLLNKLSKNSVIRHDYGLYEYTIYVYKKK